MYVFVYIALQDSVQAPKAAEAMDQVEQLQLPVEAEILKQVCRPVVKIQQALENIEEELTASENDETMFAKVGAAECIV